MEEILTIAAREGLWIYHLPRDQYFSPCVLQRLIELGAINAKATDVKLVNPREFLEQLKRRWQRARDEYRRFKGLMKVEGIL